VRLFDALPTTEAVVLDFAAWEGLTYMASLPHNNGPVARLFGLACLPAQPGVLMLVHQCDAFLGA
jgi:hypothetical protein